MKGDLADTLGSRTNTASASTLEGLSEEVVAGGVTSNAAVDHTAEQGGATEAVGTVDTTSQLTTGIETLEGLLVLVDDFGLVVDLNTTHGKVKDGLHHGDVEVIINVEGGVVEILLAPRILLLAVGNGVVRLKGLLEVVWSTANLLGELDTGHLLHEPSARVVTGVEVENLGGLGVEYQANGELVLLLLLPHHTRDVITVTELIAKSVAVSIEKKATFTSEGLGGQELPLGAGVLRVDQTSGMNLDLVHVDAVTANGHDHLLAITSRMSAVGGGKTVCIGSVLLEERGVGEIGGITSGSEDNRAVERKGLAVQFIGDTVDSVALLVKARHAGLLDNLNTLRLVLGELLEALHQGVGDGHARELGIMTSVCSGLRVATKRRLAMLIYLRGIFLLPQTRDKGEIEVELILKPLNGGSRLVGEDLDKIGASLVTGRLEGIVVKLLDAVGDARLDLGAGEGTVDTGRRLCGVAAEEACGERWSARPVMVERRAPMANQRG